MPCDNIYSSFFLMYLRLLVSATLFVWHHWNMWELMRLILKYNGFYRICLDMLQIEGFAYLSAQMCNTFPCCSSIFKERRERVFFFLVGGSGVEKKSSLFISARTTIIFIKWVFKNQESLFVLMKKDTQ